MEIGLPAIVTRAEILPDIVWGRLRGIPAAAGRLLPVLAADKRR
jgi:hypothetical protein